MRKYEPEKLFDEDGRLVAELRELAPEETAAWAQVPRQWRAVC